MNNQFIVAANVVVNQQQASVSLIQRVLKISYKEAQELIDVLEVYKIVGPFKNTKDRELLVRDQASLDVLLDQKK